jgi:enhancing lycopene biosynthesis protein 2
MSDLQQKALSGIYPYAVGIRGMNYVVVDTRNGVVQTPAYITRAKAEKACDDMNKRA